MTDPNGNTLTINSNGIIHSSGKSIVFNRDSSGRISKVSDPSGSELNYSYNLAGDLASFTDREGNTTNFSYNATHGLLTIMDPRGIQPIRNDHDACQFLQETGHDCRGIVSAILYFFFVGESRV